MAKPVTSFAPLTPATNLQANRPAPPVSGSSSQSEQPSVEAISPQTAVTPRDPDTEFQDFSQDFTGQRQRQQTPLVSRVGFDAPTETFVAIIQAQEQSGVGAPPVLSNLQGLTGKLVEKAIGIYESNIRLISGEQVERGSSVRITL